MKTAAALVIALTLTLIGCDSSSRHASDSQPQIRELRTLSELRQAFNAHAGLPRLIVLVSPT